MGRTTLAAGLATLLILGSPALAGPRVDAAASEMRAAVEAGDGERFAAAGAELRDAATAENDAVGFVLAAQVAVWKDDVAQAERDLAAAREIDLNLAASLAAHVAAMADRGEAERAAELLSACSLAATDWFYADAPLVERYASLLVDLDANALAVEEAKRAVELAEAAPEQADRLARMRLVLARTLGRTGDFDAMQDAVDALVIQDGRLDRDTLALRLEATLGRRDGVDAYANFIDEASPLLAFVREHQPDAELIWRDMRPVAEAAIEERFGTVALSLLDAQFAPRTNDALTAAAAAVVEAVEADEPLLPEGRFYVDRRAHLAGLDAEVSERVAALEPIWRTRRLDYSPREKISRKRSVATSTVQRNLSAGPSYTTARRMSLLVAESGDWELARDWEAVAHGLATAAVQSGVYDSADDYEQSQAGTFEMASDRRLKALMRIADDDLDVVEASVVGLLEDPEQAPFKQFCSLVSTIDTLTAGEADRATDVRQVLAAQAARWHERHAEPVQDDARAWAESASKQGRPDPAVAAHARAAVTDSLAGDLLLAALAEYDLAFDQATLAADDYLRLMGRATVTNAVTWAVRDRAVPALRERDPDFAARLPAIALLLGAADPRGQALAPDAHAQPRSVALRKVAADELEHELQHAPWTGEASAPRAKFELFQFLSQSDAAPRATAWAEIALVDDLIANRNIPGSRAIRAHVGNRYFGLARAARTPDDTKTLAALAAEQYRLGLDQPDDGLTRTDLLLRLAEASWLADDGPTTSDAYKDAAVAMEEEADRVTPQQVGRVYQGLAFFKKRRFAFDEALDLIDRALAADPENAAAREEKAELLRELDRAADR